MTRRPTKNGLSQGVCRLPRSAGSFFFDQSIGLGSLLGCTVSNPAAVLKIQVPFHIAFNAVIENGQQAFILLRPFSLVTNLPNVKV